ncbi:hypothetical protein IFM89_018528 [Coptis chinensis]|uniref:Agenet domain-containing protein n=1 Tax=Coptis chinensis TaxID=261450 RepID=A0A835M038_9MAGN|nr:hypothetical protein IFM89_018528 [Coptis chinensis]
MNKEVPFKVGQLAESKSFESGFRGAWFRCKFWHYVLDLPIMFCCFITSMITVTTESRNWYVEKVGWTKLYQMQTSKVPRKEKKMHLMVRPSFPSFYRTSQMPDTSTISEEIAILDDVFKVGDLVDWWSDGCYWSGRITDILGEDKVMVCFQTASLYKVTRPSPAGEGKCYEVPCKDPHPSLEWSLECGWTVPISAESEASHFCARLVQPVIQETGTNTDHSKEKRSSESSDTVTSHSSAGTSPHPEISSHSPKGTPQQLFGCALNEETQRPCVGTGSDLGDVGMISETGTNVDPSREEASSEFSSTFSSHGSAGTSPHPEISSHFPKEMPERVTGCGLIEETQKPRVVTGTDLGGVGMGKLSSSDSASSAHVERVSAAAEKTTGRDRYNSNNKPSKRIRDSGQEYLNTSYSDTLESSIMDLEELVNKIKWLKRVHQYGFRNANAVAPSWKFL